METVNFYLAAISSDNTDVMQAVEIAFETMKSEALSIMLIALPVGLIIFGLIFAVRKAIQMLRVSSGSSASDSCASYEDYYEPYLIEEGSYDDDDYYSGGYYENGVYYDEDGNEADDDFVGNSYGYSYDDEVDFWNDIEENWYDDGAGGDWRD